MPAMMSKLKKITIEEEACGLPMFDFCRLLYYPKLRNLCYLADPVRAQALVSNPGNEINALRARMQVEIRDAKGQVYPFRDKIEGKPSVI